MTEEEKNSLVNLLGSWNGAWSALGDKATIIEALEAIRCGVIDARIKDCEADYHKEFPWCDFGDIHNKDLWLYYNSVSCSVDCLVNTIKRDAELRQKTANSFLEEYRLAYGMGKLSISYEDGWRVIDPKEAACAESGVNHFTWLSSSAAKSTSVPCGAVDGALAGKASLLSLNKF